MNNRIPVIVFLIALAAAVIIIILKSGSSPQLKAAKHSESIGDKRKACAQYAEAVYTLVPAASIPDITHSKFAAPEIYRKEVEKYLSQLVENNIGKNSRITAAVAGLLRCNEDNQDVVRLVPPEVKPFTEESYIEAWKKTFFAPEAKVDPLNTSLAGGNFNRNLSLLVISCGINYSYECMLLNKSTLQATKFLLPAENSAGLYALPGEYLLITRSTVTFSGGEIWRSDYIALPISIPVKTSMVTSELKTRLPRRER